MRPSDQINAFVTVARESSADGERVRRRIGALAAVSFVVCGFLLVVGLAVLVLAFVAGLLASGALAAVVLVRGRVRAATAEWISRTRTVSTEALGAGAEHWSRLSRATVDLGRRTGSSARSRLAPAALDWSRRARREATQAAETARATLTRLAPGPVLIDQQREALRLNAAGAQQRREGRYDEAVESHRRALELLRVLDDRRAVALTQSNLALALSHSGDDEWAIGLFEEAAATLRELGDDEHEAQIMANMGLAHRRHGRREEGDNVLELALEKLDPASSAYHAIETQLSRAS